MDDEGERRLALHASARCDRRHRRGIVATKAPDLAMNQGGAPQCLDLASSFLRSQTAVLGIFAADNTRSVLSLEYGSTWVPFDAPDLRIEVLF